MLLERLFENLALTVEPFAVCEVSRGWRLRMDALDWVTLHFVLSGEGRLKIGAGPGHRLGPNTLAIVPPQLRHAIESRDEPGHETTARLGSKGEGELLQFLAGPSGQRDLIVACGRLQAFYAGSLGLFDLLKEPIVLDFSGPGPMRATFERLLEEERNPSPGSTAMMTALMNQCLVLIFRRLSDSSDRRLPWLDALEDPRLAKVLGMILERPERHYSLESLADHALMSRSAFVQVFVASFGRTPMAFVRDVRLRRAAELLRGTNLSVDALASRVGFASRSHFSHAFREYFGRSPAAFRRGPSEPSELVGTA